MGENKTEQLTDNTVEQKEAVTPEVTTEVTQEQPPENVEVKQPGQPSEKKEEPSSNPKLDNLIRKAQYIALIILIVFLVWYFVISPMITFKQSEKIVEEAGKSYFELNYTQLPTGERTATVTLQDLFTKSFIKEDIYIPHTDEPCSLKDSWVKVKRVNGEYKYYTYLKCGLLQSSIDHEGPEIVLNGEEEMTLALGEEYKEPGVKSVTDKEDGDIPIENVVIKDSALNVNEIGEYEITYTAVDSLNNKTTVKRTITVVETLSSVVKKDNDGNSLYVGANPNNYLYFSGILFRIIGIDGKNIKIIAAEDIANVNYDGLDEWLDYFDEHLTENSKKYIVKNKYCNMAVDESTKASTECTDYTKKRKYYIASVTDINSARDSTGNWLEPKSISWTANKDSTNESKAYVTRDKFYAEYYDQEFISEDITNNYGVRPVITIEDTLIKSGTGTADNPYSIGDTKSGKADDKLNTRNSGEYVLYTGMLWRIIEVNSDGTVKVISDDTLKKNGQNITTSYSTKSETKIYNPTESGNIGYFIKNKASEYVETSYFVNKNVKVPIYKDKILYGQEVETKKYKTKLSAPNIYEMFSAFVYDGDSMQSHWFINSSQTQFVKAAITDIGVVRTDEVYDYEKFGVRVVANFHENVIITKGNGTKNNPYNITK